MNIMSDAPFHSLTDVSDWADARDASESKPVVLFKHSSACPTSARANDEMSELASDDVTVYRVVVQDARDVSDQIAEDLDIRHETPQAIVLSNGTPVFDTSHFRVKADTVREALASASV